MSDNVLAGVGKGLWHATRQVVLVAVRFVPGVLLHRGAGKAAESVAWDPEADRARDRREGA